MLIAETVLQGRPKSLEAQVVSSGLAARLGRHIALTSGEGKALIEMEHVTFRLDGGDVLVSEGDTTDLIYILQQGWMHSSLKLSSGTRQIVGFHYAGDLINTSNIVSARASMTLTAVSDCVVSSLTRETIGILFGSQPRIAGLLYAIAIAENLATSERLASIGRMTADQRITLLLLEVLTKLRFTMGGIVNSFDLPLTQKDIGDALGLTKVHVNRTLRGLERAGSIERNGRRIRIMDEAALTTALDFPRRDDIFATDWLPSALF